MALTLIIKMISQFAACCHYKLFRTNSTPKNSEGIASLSRSQARGLVTIDMLWRVRPSIRLCLLSCDVRSKGEAFPSKRVRLKKFNVVQPKTPIISLFVREMLRPYKCRENHSGTGRCTSSQFLIPN